MSTLRELKQLQGSDKWLVFGYIRRIEKELKIPNVTMLIIYKILEYFYLNEYFDKHGDVIQVSEDKRTITRIGDKNAWNNNSYGNIWIKSNGNEIARWKFEMDHVEMRQELYFQFLSKDIRLNEDGGREEDAPNYAWSNKFDIDCHGACGSISKTYDYSSYPRTGDQVIIELNTKERTIRCKVRDAAYETIFEQIEQGDDIKYKMAITLHAVGMKVTMIDFQCVNADCNQGGDFHF